MNQNRAVEKAMLSIESIVPLDDDQYKAVAHHLLLMYGVGFDEGRRKEPHQMVGQFLDGMLLHSYESINQASAETGLTKKRIVIAIKKKYRIQACTWEWLNG